MKVSISLELASFSVPDSVAVKGNIGLKQQGFEAQRKIHLSELSRETLVALCEEFTGSVLAKAAKALPTPSENR